MSNRKKVHYKHKRRKKPSVISVSKAIGRNLKKLLSFLWKKIKKNKLRSLIVFLMLAIVLALIVSHLNKQAQQISSDGYIHSDRFANSVIIDGIDVSYAQGGDINWKEVKKSGVDFVFVRAGFRDASKGKLHRDAYFDQNIVDAKKAGLMVGAYYYSQAVTKSEARKEARAFVQLVEPYDIDLPLVMDYELFDGGRLAKKISNGELFQDQITDISLAFCNTIASNGYEPMVYGNYDFLMNKQNVQRLSENVDIWVAHYANSTSFNYPYTFWQCSQEEKVPGFQKPIDKDFGYFDPTVVSETKTKSSYERRSISSCNIKMKRRISLVGYKAEPDVSIYDGKYRLRKGLDYQLAYVNNTSPGEAYAIIRGIGNYKDTIYEQFKIKKFF